MLHKTTMYLERVLAYVPLKLIILAPLIIPIKKPSNQQMRIIKIKKRYEKCQKNFSERYRANVSERYRANVSCVAFFSTALICCSLKYVMFH